MYSLKYSLGIFQLMFRS